MPEFTILDFGQSQAPGGQTPGGPAGRSSTTSVVTTALELRAYDSVPSAILTASALRSVSVVSQSSGTVIETNLPADGTVQAGEGSVRFGSRAEALHLETAEAELQQARDTATPWLFNALIDTQVALIKDIPTPYPDTGEISDVPGVQASARSTNSLNIRGAGRGLQVAVTGTNNDEMTKAVDT
ncbi:hypothetical protein [Meridianimarinicoccus aquatilis]|uniref:Uncharacterized protein n=1 Tax=Meridianimarinicoccus aquatilis TaxID=2552766 RepID=A0A4R6B1C0_9RHOB|nr:hypothetical protein [Fluviibacterium aquatile]TDL90951.1 hypothetical protein E2L05_02810 [Fluviibacterium aquatile]